ncbi:MAG TPA: HTTM domain-containing protein, partial [Polyangiaceae bacterium]|nr:HTTM domain-containing protein [Polyangiaceae bacterium]
MTIASRQGHSDNPFSYAFWLGGIDPRPAALFRIALGLTILHDLLDLTRDLRAFLTDEGMLPRGTFSGPYAWTCFDWVGSPLAVSALYAVGFGTVVAFTLGYATRAATIATWLFVSSLHHRNNYVTDGGDDVVRILLFWSIFANLGAAYSVDARRAATRVISVPALPVRILQLQIAVLYFAAARLKFRLGWLHGDQIFYALQLDGFARPPGTFLTRFPSLCRLATKAILGMEFLFAFAAFSPVAIRFSRTVAIALGLAIQLGILTTMRVGIFTEAMLSVVWLFVLPEWIDAAEAWARKRYRLATDARPSSVVESPRWRVALNAFVLLQFVAAIWGVVAARRFPLPKVVAREIKLLDVEAKYSLFDVTYAIPRWEAPGLLADGTPVEVLSVVAPGAMPRGPNVRFSRWNKLTFKEREFPFYP